MLRLKPHDFLDAELEALQNLQEMPHPSPKSPVNIRGQTVLINLSGRGDKDVEQMMEVLNVDRVV